jgi:hypothetical protein
LQKIYIIRISGFLIPILASVMASGGDSLLHISPYVCLRLSFAFFLKLEMIKKLPKLNVMAHFVLLVPIRNTLDFGHPSFDTKHFEPKAGTIELDRNRKFSFRCADPWIKYLTNDLKN